MVGPTFSIIMMSYNYSAYIGAAIDSVIKQTFSDWELLVVDDCSTDDSWRVIQDFKDSRIRTHRHQVNLGACAAYNQALSMAQGKYIACLDSDDVFMPNKLEQQVEFLEQHPEIDICGTFVTEIDNNGAANVEPTPYADWFNVSVDLNDPSTWLWQNRVCHSGAVVRKDLHARLGDFDNGLVYTPDWQFWLRALVAGARFSVIQEPLVAYRNHGDNITHKNRKGTLLEHANTCSHILFPWLKQQGRRDLIETTLQGFLGNPLLASERDLQSSCAEALFSGRAAVDVGASVIFLAIQQEQYLAEVMKGKEWLESKLSEQSAQLSEQSVQLQRLKSAFPVRVLRKMGLISYG